MSFIVLFRSIFSLFFSLFLIFMASWGHSQIVKPFCCINSSYFFCGGGRHQNDTFPYPVPSRWHFIILRLAPLSLMVHFQFCGLSVKELDGTEGVHSGLFCILQSSVNCNVFLRAVPVLSVDSFKAASEISPNWAKVGSCHLLEGVYHSFILKSFEIIVNVTVQYKSL